MRQTFDPAKGLRLRQVDQKLAAWRLLPRQPPRGGWLRGVREALGMSAAQLAHRLGVSRQALAALERRELKGAVSISGLSKVADAMDCDVVYAIVPRSDLRSIVERQARSQAEAELRKAAHTMRLEAQGVSQEETDRLIQERTTQLLQSTSGRFWDFHGAQEAPLKDRASFEKGS